MVEISQRATENLSVAWNRPRGSIYTMDTENIQMSASPPPSRDQMLNIHWTPLPRTQLEREKAGWLLSSPALKATEPGAQILAVIFVFIVKRTTKTLPDDVSHLPSLWQ